MRHECTITATWGEWAEAWEAADAEAGWAEDPQEEAARWALADRIARHMGGADEAMARYGGADEPTHAIAIRLSPADIARLGGWAWAPIWA